MGVTSKVPAYPSIFIGSYEASLFDMVGAYSAFVNHGTWTEPTYLLRIEDKNGNVLYEKSAKVVDALDSQTAYAITDMLKGVVQEGTASRIQWRYNLKNPIGGKTGTSQNNSDGWFIGTTPQLVTGVWTGCEDRAIHFPTTEYGSGTNTALPLFALYMKKVYADKSLKYTRGDFEPPKEGSTITLDCSSYNRQVKVVSDTVKVEEKTGNN
jgi:penicillin-binding protein 1A